MTRARTYGKSFKAASFNDLVGDDPDCSNAIGSVTVATRGTNHHRPGRSLCEGFASTWCAR